MSRDLFVTARTALTPMLWGTTYIVATELLPDGRPLLAACVRALPIGLVFLLWSRRLPAGVWWWRSALLGTLNIGAFFALLFVAAFRLPGGVAATAGAIQPLIATGIAAVVLGEMFTRRTVAAGISGLAGVAMLVLGPGAALDSVGVTAAIGGTLCMATGVVLTKHWGRPVDLITFTGWQLSAGGLLLLPILLVTEGLPSTITTGNIAGFAWLAVVGTGAAYANWFDGIQRLPVAIVSFLALLSPLVATVVGWVLLEQTLTATQLAGAALVLAAVVTPHLRRRIQRTTAPDDVNGQATPSMNEDSRDDGSEEQVGDVVVLASVNVKIGPLPEVPDIAGDLRCRLLVEVPADGSVDVVVTFSGERDCLQPG